MCESTDSIENKPSSILRSRQREVRGSADGTDGVIDGVGGVVAPQSESDTDSVSTPTDSPAKARLASLKDVTPPPLFTGKTPHFCLLQRRKGF